MDANVFRQNSHVDTSFIKSSIHMEVKATLQLYLTLTLPPVHSLHC